MLIQSLAKTDGLDFVALFSNSESKFLSVLQTYKVCNLFSKRPKVSGASADDSPRSSGDLK